MFRYRRVVLFFENIDHMRNFNRIVRRHQSFSPVARRFVRYSNKVKVEVKLSLCFFFFFVTDRYATKAYWGTRVLDLSTRWRRVVSFTPRALYPQGKSPWYPLDRRLDLK
jgi:hypothetical protein